MEQMEGSLADVIVAAHRSDKYLTLKEQIDLAIGSLSGLLYLHSAKPKAILHGDMRPTNILISPVMVAKVGDLGTAHFIGASLSVGPVSIEYVAPERMPKLGRSPHNTSQADIYSTGATLAELFTGQQAGPDDRPKQLRSITEPLLQDLCLQMTDTNPDERLTAHQSLQILESITKSGYYTECSPKRMVRGIQKTGDQTELTYKPW